MARKDGKDRGLFERPKGSGIWWIRYADHLGKERRKKVGSKSNARKAYQKQKDLVRRIRLGLASPEKLTRRKPLTLKEFIKSCTPELKEFASWKSMERMATMWVKGIGHLPLDQVKPEHAIGRRSALLQKGRTNATCNRETSFLKSILNRAVEQGVLKQNPLEHLKLLPEKKKRTRIAQGNEEEKLRSVMAQNDFDVVEVAIQTGLRRGVLLSLPWKQIDFHNELIDVQGAKGDTSRLVPMTSRVKEILERRYSEKSSLWVFPNKSGKNHINPNNWYNRVWRPALREAGVEGLTIHDLRRTFASRMAQAGQGGRALTGILGHSSSKTTDRYAHTDVETHRAAIKQTFDQSDGSRGLRLVK